MDKPTDQALQSCPQSEQTHLYVHDDMNANSLLKHNANWTPSELPNLTTCTFWQKQDLAMMQMALKLATQGGQLGEVPVGAVLVHNQDKRMQILGRGFNRPILDNDPTSHAEIVALRQACTRLNNYRLPQNCTLYVTLEPCTMCLGALIHARVARLVFATNEPRSGVVGSRLNLPEQNFYNHHLTVQSGLLADQSASLLKKFFRSKRQNRKT